MHDVKASFAETSESKDKVLVTKRSWPFCEKGRKDETVRNISIDRQFNVDTVYKRRSVLFLKRWKGNHLSLGSEFYSERTKTFQVGGTIESCRAVTISYRCQDRSRTYLEHVICLRNDEKLNYVRNYVVLLRKL
ncbi:uncharacterized protein LOC143151698 isoform X1 [Ptiloglossa arizonensis]|uniref:uncharacterized protein LOC143151698 isoform X1 n=1 Tax=Ptiloglossa arizonensis TaxID=3350558 RepID=UPI003F9F0541